MKKVSVYDAVGMALCHDITAVQNGIKGSVFKRGYSIQEDDIPKLLDIGKRTVFVWEENAGEIHEEDCAHRLAAMTTVTSAHYEGPSEGKIVSFADTCGMFRVDTQLLNQINAIGDITICTLPDHFPVKEGDRLASMRIVPLVTKEEQIIQAEELCKGKQLFDLHPYHHKKIGIIITGSEIYHGRIQDKFEPLIRQKMKQYPSEIIGVTICDDDIDMIVNAAQSHLNAGADLLIFTGGMSVDPDDLTPTAIRKLGAKIVTHGVPAQPGNMTLIAYLNDVAILGVPGAAFHARATVFDVVLLQVFAGDKFTKQELVRLGEGGLCYGCKTCHFPVCSFGRY